MPPESATDRDVLSTVETFRIQKDLATEVVLTGRNDGDEEVEPDQLKVLNPSLLEAARPIYRLVRQGHISQQELHQACMAHLCLQLRTQQTSMTSIRSSVASCLDIRGVAQGSIMELLLDSDIDWVEALHKDESSILDLPTLLSASKGRPKKKNRMRASTVEQSLWKVSLVFVLGQLAYDTLCQLPFTFTVSELVDKMYQLAESFGTLRNSSFLENGIYLFLFDLYLHKRGNVEGLTLEYVVNKVTQRR